MLAAFLAGAAWNRVQRHQWIERQEALASVDDTLARLVAFAAEHGWYVTPWSDPDEVFNRRRVP